MAVTEELTWLIFNIGITQPISDTNNYDYKVCLTDEDVDPNNESYISLCIATHVISRVR